MIYYVFVSCWDVKLNCLMYSIWDDCIEIEPTDSLSPKFENMYLGLKLENSQKNEKKTQLGLFASLNRDWNQIESEPV